MAALGSKTRFADKYCDLGLGVAYSFQAFAGEVEGPGKGNWGVVSVREFKDETEEKCPGEKLEVRKQFPETDPICYKPTQPPACLFCCPGENCTLCLPINPEQGSFRYSRRLQR